MYSYFTVQVVAAAVVVQVVVVAVVVVVVVVVVKFCTACMWENVCVCPQVHTCVQEHVYGHVQMCVLCV